MSEHLSVGLDLGRSAVKVVARQGKHEHRFMFPSAVTKARRVVFDQMRAKAAIDTVELDGETYWTGETALMQDWDKDATGREDDWVGKFQHDVLVQSAMDRLVRAGAETSGKLVVVTIGVPSRVFRQRRDLVETVQLNTGAVLERGGIRARVYVHPQPIGVIGKYTLTADGHVAPGRSLAKDSFLVVEVGQFTTDFAAVVKGSPIVDATHSTDGVEVIVNHIRSKLRDQHIEIGNLDMLTVMTERTIRIRGRDFDLSPYLEEGVNKVFLPKILEQFRATFPPVLMQTTDSVLVAGGGAPIVFEALRSNPMASHAILIDDPRMAVADGFARLSAMTQRNLKVAVAEVAEA